MSHEHSLLPGREEPCFRSQRSAPFCKPTDCCFSMRACGMVGARCRIAKWSTPAPACHPKPRLTAYKALSVTHCPSFHLQRTDLGVLLKSRSQSGPSVSGTLRTPLNAGLSQVGGLAEPHRSCSCTQTQVQDGKSSFSPFPLRNTLCFSTVHRAWTWGSTQRSQELVGNIWELPRADSWARLPLALCRCPRSRVLQ